MAIDTGATMTVPIEATQPSLLVLLVRYGALTFPLFTLWEVAQLPLYTIWSERSVWGSVGAALHCTLGDLVIAEASLLLALLPGRRFRGLRRSAFAAPFCVLAGLIATIAIETYSLRTGRWAYSAAMPVVSLLGIGWSPLLQWLVIPSLALVVLRGRFDRYVSR